MGKREADGSEYKLEGRIYRSSIWETKGHKRQETAKRIRATAAFFLSIGNLLVFHAGGNNSAEKAATQKRHFWCVSFENSQMVRLHHMGLMTYFALQW